MAEKETLLKLFQTAKKAADMAACMTLRNGPEVSRCLEAFDKLRSYAITKDLLLSTMIAKRLRPLKKHPNEAVRLIASDIFQRWKTVFLKELADEEEARTKPKLVERTTTGKVIVETVLNKNTTIAPSRSQNGDVSGNRIRERLVAALSRVASEVDDQSLRREVEANCDPLRVALAVESAMLEKIDKPDHQKKRIMRSILFNIGDPKNPDLRRKVLLGEIEAERLVTMSNAEMASEAMQAQIRQIEERALVRCETGRGDSLAGDKATTDQFKCGRCGERKAVYHQMQTRSADEPMTTYVTCVNCNHHWKFC